MVFGLGLSEKRNRRISMHKRHRDAACTVFRIDSYQAVLIKGYIIRAGQGIALVCPLFCASAELW